MTQKRSRKSVSAPALSENINSACKKYGGENNTEKGMDAEGHGQEDAGQAVRREHELDKQGPFRTERQRDIAPDQGGGREGI